MLSKKNKKHSSSSNPSKRKLFGAPIIKTSEASIPLFVFLFIQFLRQNPKQGLFRVPGSTQLIQKAKQDLESGNESLYLYQKEYTHVVASLLKMWFRELPEPLLTFDHYDMFIAADGINEETARLATIKKVLHYLPEANRKLLYSLCEFLHDLLEFQEETKMHAGNLAIVFAPNLLRPRVEDFGTMMSDTPHATGLMQTLIEEFEFLFADFLSEERKERERLREKALESMNGGGHRNEDGTDLDNSQRGTSPANSKQKKHKKSKSRILPSLPSKSSSKKLATTTQFNATGSSSAKAPDSPSSPVIKIPNSFDQELRLKIQQSAEKRVSLGSGSSPSSPASASKHFSAGTPVSGTRSSRTLSSDGSAASAMGEKSKPKPETPVRSSSLVMKLTKSSSTDDTTSSRNSNSSSKLTVPPSIPPKSGRSLSIVHHLQSEDVNTLSTPTSAGSARKALPALPPKPQGLSPPPPIPDRKGRSRSMYRARERGE